MHIYIYIYDIRSTPATLPKAWTKSVCFVSMPFATVWKLCFGYEHIWVCITTLHRWTPQSHCRTPPVRSASRPLRVAPASRWGRQRRHALIVVIIAIILIALITLIVVIIAILLIVVIIAINRRPVSCIALRTTASSRRADSSATCELLLQ